MGRKDRLQGTLDLLVLKTLTRGPMHGFGIALHILTVSEGVLELEEGSLYPALQRMLNAGWVTAKWKSTENKRLARYYALTDAGRRQLEEAQENWSRVTAAVTLVMERTRGG